MTTPAEIAPLLQQAWELFPDQNFFELLYEVTQTNSTLFALGDTTNDDLKAALEAFIASGGNVDAEAVQSEPATDEGDPQGNTSSEA